MIFLSCIFNDFLMVQEFWQPGQTYPLSVWHSSRWFETVKPCCDTVAQLLIQCNYTFSLSHVNTMMVLVRAFWLALCDFGWYIFFKRGFHLQCHSHQKQTIVTPSLYTLSYFEWCRILYEIGVSGNTECASTAQKSNYPPVNHHVSHFYHIESH